MTRYNDIPELCASVVGLPTHLTLLPLKQTASAQNAWAVWCVCTAQVYVQRSPCRAAMPPKARRKLGYNWRARQTRHDGSTTRKSLATRFEASEQVEDINALVLPPRPKKRIKEAEERGSKRKKLSAKQRKRLMKVLEVKEKKTKVCSN